MTDTHKIIQTVGDLATAESQAQLATIIAEGVVNATSAPATVSYTETGTSPATERLWRVELTLTPASTVGASGGGSLAAIRGCLTLSSAKTGTGFMLGVQGKLVADGATIDAGSNHVTSLYGQLSLSGSTVTSGHVAAVIADIQDVPTSAFVDLFYGESATGNVINSMFKAFGKATYVFDLESNVHTQMATTSGSVTNVGTKGWLKVNVEGVTRYIPLGDGVS